MARVNISMPDDLYQEAKRLGLNVSQVAQNALSAEVDRRAKIAALDTYLAELDAELGSLSVAERAEADRWADRVLGPESSRHSA